MSVLPLPVFGAVLLILLLHPTVDGAVTNCQTDP